MLIIIITGDDSFSNAKTVIVFKYRIVCSYIRTNTNVSRRFLFVATFKITQKGQGERGGSHSTSLFLKCCEQDERVLKQDMLS